MSLDNGLLPQVEAIIRSQPKPTTDQERSKLIELVFPLLMETSGTRRGFILQLIVEHWGITLKNGVFE